MIWICWWRTFAADLDARYLLLTLNISSVDHPGRAFAVLLGRNDASTDPTKHRDGTQIKHPSGFGQGDFTTLSPLAVHIDCNAVRITEATDTRLRPSVQPAGSLSGSVEHTGNGPYRASSARMRGPGRLFRARLSNASDLSGSSSL